MPWETPSLRVVRQLVRDSIRANLPGADALIPNSVLRVLSDNQGALCHLTLQYVDWLALQLIPDTAETEWLDRHGAIWLVNSDGSTGRKMAQLASGVVNFTGSVPWSVIPQGTRLSYMGGTVIAHPGGLIFETTEQIFLSATAVETPVRVRALDPGTIGNLPPGTSLAVMPPVSPRAGVVASPPPGVDSTVRVVYLEGGVDEETDDELRFRVLQRIRHPPQGGAWHDYIKWALAVPGVTRAWVHPLEMGMGTTTVRFMCDSLRAERDGFPVQQDIDAVTAYLDTVRPVAVKDFFVVSPIPERIDVQIRQLEPDNPAVRNAIATNLRAMLFEKAAPGETVYGAWLNHAIMDAPGVISFNLANCDVDRFMPSPGHLGVLGSIVYGG